MKLRIAGVQVYLSIGIFPLIAVGIVFGETKLMLCTLLALLLHESAHRIASRNLGYAVTGLSLYPFGAVMHLMPLCAEAGKLWLAAAAGPIGSFVCASALQLLSAAAGVRGEWIDLLCGANLAVSLMNLLPAVPLDGGRIAKSILNHAMSDTAANRILLVFSFCIGCGMLALGVLLLLRGVPAWSLTAMAPFLIAAAIRETKEGGRGKALRVIERSVAVRSGKPMPARIVVIRPETTVGDAIQAISAVHFTLFRVADGKRSLTVDEEQLLSAASLFGYRAAVGSVFLFDQQKIPCYNTLFKTSSQIGAER